MLDGFVVMEVVLNTIGAKKKKQDLMILFLIEFNFFIVEVIDFFQSLNIGSSTIINFKNNSYNESLQGNTYLSNTKWFPHD